jgi:hypothetical protein
MHRKRHKGVILGTSGMGHGSGAPSAPLPLPPPCPLCVHHPIIDHRWARCSACHQMYHHICALYNELGSGRFFCPRDSCQMMSNGTGQLSHASSASLVDTPLSEYLTAKAQAATSSGLQITVKVVVSIWMRVWVCVIVYIFV